MCLFLSNSPCRFADANAGANCFAAGNFYSVLLASSLLQAIFTACCWLHLCCLSLFACWLLIAGRLPAVASSHSVLIAQAASLLPMRCHIRFNSLLPWHQKKMFGPARGRPKRPPNPMGAPLGLPKSPAARPVTVVH